MAGGIPVIAKRDECIENIVDNNKTGLLFETEEDLTEKLYMLLSTPSLQKGFLVLRLPKWNYYL